MLGALCRPGKVASIFSGPPADKEHDSRVVDDFLALPGVKIVGGSSNLGHADIAFKQQGIMPRRKAIELLAQKLRSEGRLVDIKQV